MTHICVIPAEAGIQGFLPSRTRSWIREDDRIPGALDPRLRGDDGRTDPRSAWTAKNKNPGQARDFFFGASAAN
jgi:hypothetical protein